MVTESSEEPGSGAQASVAEAGGVLSPALGLLATLSQMIYTRLELVFLDVQQGVSGVAALVVWSAIAVFAAAFGLFIGALALIFAFWDTHRILVSVLVMAGFLLLAAIAAWQAVSRLRAQRELFATTLEEFAKDREYFRP